MTALHPRHRGIRLNYYGAVQIGRDDRKPGMWFGPRGQPKAEPGMSSRARVGMGDPEVLNAPGQMAFFATERQLLPSQYWKLYKTSDDVRACVDSIARRISTWDWRLKVTVDPRNRAEYGRVAKIAKAKERWLRYSPNVNPQPWQSLMMATCIDLLVYEAGAWELAVRGRDLAEIVPWSGFEWFPEYDDKRVLQHYRQEKEGLPTATTKPVTLPPERMVYFSLFPNNRDPLGVPLLDTLVNQCVTVLLSNEHAMMALDADEIPPGLLVLGGVAGAAAERARADLQQMRGSDHRVRVISSPQPNGIKAEWVEMRHTIKDLEMLKVVEAMRRAIWRVFGVMPVELGETDGVPRAHAEVQVDVSSSHLITPMLELVQAQMNAQVLPLLLGAEAENISFQFDRKAQLTPDERLALAQAQDTQVRRGIITINEARAELGLLPVDGGDVPIVDTNEGPRPLTQVAAGLDVEGNDGSTGGDGDDGGEEPEPDDEPDDDAEPRAAQATGTAKVGSMVTRGQCCEAHWPGVRALAQQRLRLYGNRAEDYLPSDWPEAQRFDSYRIMDIDALAAVVRQYGSTVAREYAQATSDVQVLLLRAYGDDERLDPSEAAEAHRAIEERLDQLAATWATLTAPLYQQAAEVGRAGAEDIAGGPVDMNTEAEAQRFATTAMQQLTDDRGLVGTLKQLARRVVDAATVGSRVQPLAPGHRDRIDQLSPDDGPEAALHVMEASFVAQAHRIDNWSGRMVGLANTMLVEGLNRTVSTVDGQPVEWWCEWVNAGGRTCPICDEEGAQGFRAITDLTRRPGEDTYCTGNCRCVLVFWTKREVDGGQAVALSALAPGGPDA